MDDNKHRKASMNSKAVRSSRRPPPPPPSSSWQPQPQLPSHLSRSCSVAAAQKGSPAVDDPVCSKSPLLRSFSHTGGVSLSRKCSSLVKEHKARFYIMRRCIAMLACWHEHDEHG